VGEILIRRAGAGDLEAVRQLLELLSEHQKAWRVFEPRSGYREEIMNRYRRALGAAHARHLLAEDDGELVGMAFAEEITPSGFSDERACEVTSVVVRPSHRRAGVGRGLMAGVIAFARERGLARLTLHTFMPNEEARAFFEGLGFWPRYVQLIGDVEDLAAGLGLPAAAGGTSTAAPAETSSAPTERPAAC